MTEQKYKAGDLVTVKIDDVDAFCLNVGNAGNFGALWLSQIISHEPAPFDWKDVKPGMAFRHKDKDGVFTFIGRSTVRDSYVFDSPKTHRYLYDGFEASQSQLLTRAPEHDNKEMMG